MQADEKALRHAPLSVYFKADSQIRLPIRFRRATIYRSLVVYTARAEESTHRLRHAFFRFSPASR